MESDTHKTLVYTTICLKCKANRQGSSVLCLFGVFLIQKLHLSVHIEHCRAGSPLKRQFQQYSCFTNCLSQDTWESKSIFSRIYVSDSDTGSSLALQVLRALCRQELISFVYVIKISTSCMQTSMWQTKQPTFQLQ